MRSVASRIIQCPESFVARRQKGRQPSCSEGCGWENLITDLHFSECGLLIGCGDQIEYSSLLLNDRVILRVFSRLATELFVSIWKGGKSEWTCELLSCTVCMPVAVQTLFDSTWQSLTCYEVYIYIYIEREQNKPKARLEIFAVQKALIRMGNQQSKYDH